MKPAYAIAMLAALGLGLAGRFLAEPIQHREIGMVELASEQVLGGLRSVPLIRLWQRAEQAHKEGRYYEESAIYDLINELNPANGATIAYQAMTEGRHIAGMQRTREEAWQWVEVGLKRLAEARKRRSRGSEVHQTQWLLGFFAGRAFPTEFTASIAATYDEPEMLLAAQALQASMPTSESFRTFLHGEWNKNGFGDGLRKADGRSELSKGEQRWVNQAEFLLWQALSMVAGEAIDQERFQSSTAVTFAISSLGFAAEVAAEIPENKALVESLRAARPALIEAEFERLNDAGYPDYARSFREVSYRQIGIVEPDAAAQN
ncbi:MAG: hypothetical protein KDB07_12400 [Planctomycetes bacterium]|nr:hypothetical protein [Planctomycetota bacterium]